MPIFEFSCNKCGKTIEKIMSFEQSEKSNMKCDCGEGVIKKNKVAPCNLSFKGNWFVNNKTY